MIRVAFRYEKSGKVNTMLKSPTYQIHWISQGLGGSPTRERNSRLLSTAVDLTLWITAC